jgi:hypothetical protein
MKNETVTNTENVRKPHELAMLREYHVSNKG